MDCRNRPNAYIIDGDDAWIILTLRNSEEECARARIDAADVPIVSNRRWGRHTHGYVYHSNSHTLLHRFLTGAPHGSEVDHINGDRSDNRRCNLRVLTHSQNAQNVRCNRDLPRGVYYAPYRLRRTGVLVDMWSAKVKIGGVLHHLGSFRSAAEAADVASMARIAAFPFSNEDRHRIVGDAEIATAS